MRSTRRVRGRGAGAGDAASARDDDRVAARPGDAGPAPAHWPPAQGSADQWRLPCWTTGAKDGVGTATAPRSRIWFTLVGGALTEVYFPTIDQANTRELRIVVTGPDGFFADETRDARTTLSPLADGVPGYRVRSRLHGSECVLEKVVVADDERAAVLVALRLEAPETAEGLRVHVLLSPHIANQGSGNDGWLGRYKGVPMLFARRGERALALGCSARFLAGACGHEGSTDAWHDLRAHGRLTRRPPHAYDGNLLLAAELDAESCRSPAGCVLALAFGDSAEDAGQQARAALQQSFQHAVDSYVRGWHAYQQRCRPVADDEPAVARGYQVSLAVLRAHEDKAHSGATIASLAIPWGEARGDHDSGGYHLIWARDLVETAGGLLAAGLTESARLALLYLMSTQEPSGHWPQNMWLDGKAYWRGVQLDEAGLPVLLATSLARQDALGGVDVWPMVRRAASYIVLNGPVTPEDRWEESAGYSPFTLAVEVAALLAAAEFAQARGEAEVARYLRETADHWNANIERWTYVTGTELAGKLGLEGYYVRLAPPPHHAARSATGAQMTLKNHPMQSATAPYGAVVSPDALALVRFGLRDAHDPRLLATVQAIDAVLRTETPTGPVWHRFTGDEYGEHEDGSPFDGSGIGRGWPLLAGERAHYEVARGDLDSARALRRTMLAQASAGGLIPEQVWDADDIPARGLVRGRPTGSAMPLVWAHAEYLKLCRSIEERRVFDTPPLVVERYGRKPPRQRLVVWRADNGVRSMPAGTVLRVERHAPFAVRWRLGGAERHGSIEARDSGLGVWYADLPTAKLPAGAEVRFGTRGAPAASDERGEHALRVGKSDE